MNKVTAVKRQKKNPKRFNVYLDDQFAFGADEDLVVNFRLLPGKVIDPVELEKIVFEAQAGKWLEKVYGLLARRQRSEKEIRDYFRIQNSKSKFLGKEIVSSLVIDFVIKRLKDKGMTSDKEFAQAWVDSRRRSKLKSNRSLRAELYQKGIDQEMITQVLGNSDEENLAEQTLQKKLKSWKNLEGAIFKKKAIEYLLRKGFDYNKIVPIVDKLSKKR